VTVFDLWDQIQQFGTGFVLFLGVILFFSGRLMNGEVARQARKDSEDALIKSHGEQMALMRQRYDDMQEAWKTRTDELVRERDYYRSIALTFARHAEQGLALASDKLPPLP
jgi:hypothetical protein